MRRRLVLAVGLVWLLAACGGEESRKGGDGDPSERAPSPIPDGAVASDLRQKLDALEEARNAGVLDESEYARKREAVVAEIEKARGVVSPEVAEKLKALDEARDAGILSEEEYRRKREALLAGGARPDTRPPPPPPPPAAAGEPLRFHLAKAGISFSHPPDWKPRPFEDGAGVALIRGRASLSLLLSEDGGTSRAARDEIAAQIRGQWRDVREIGRRDRAVGGETAAVLEFTGVNRAGLEARARVAALVARGRRHVFFLVAPREEFDACVPAWDVVLDGFRWIRVPEAKKEGKTFQHPIGFRFWYPADWRANASTEGGVFLLPPDLVVRDGEPMEYYVVCAAEVPAGSTQPGGGETLSPEQAKQMLRQQVPNLVGEPTVRTIDMAGGKGILIDCQVRIEGVLARVRMYLTIVESRAACLVALALPQLIDKRNDAIERVFASFAFGRAAASTDVVGTWSLSRTYSSGSHDTPVTWTAADGSAEVESSSSVSVVSEDTTTVEIRPDGTFTETKKEFFLAMGGYNPITGGSIVLGSDKPTVTTTRGRWRAGGGTLCFMDDEGGQALAEYRVETSREGRRMLVKTDGRLQVWK